jgi:hypothetical protein
MSAVPPEAPLRRGFFTRRPPGAAPAQDPLPPRPHALPERHGGTGFSLVGRGPSVAFATWDLPHGVGEGWGVEFRCEGESVTARSFNVPASAHAAYLEGLTPGGRYRVTATLRSPEGAARTLLPAVAELALPPVEPGAGTVRFARAPWAAGPAGAVPAPAGLAAPFPETVLLPTSPGGPGPGGSPGSPGLPSSAALRMPTSPGAR